MLKKTGSVIVVLLACLQAKGQYIQFSQYNYAIQRVNPALVAASDYASMSFLYRNQSTGSDFNLNSSMFSAAYPLLHARSGKRWSGIGLTLLDDRSGTAGLFNTQEVSLSYAANVHLSKWQTLSLGARGLYQQQKVNPSRLYTGMQYIPDRGFDESRFSGENFGELQVNYFTLSLGLYWQQVDRNNKRVAYWGISFFDFNNPQNGFLNGDSQLNTTSVAAAGLRLVNRGALSVMPELLYTRSYANNVLNIGAVTSYDVNTASNTGVRIDLLTKYVIGRSAIAGIQFHKENFSFGFSYDFPLFSKNPGNLGAIEFGVELKGLVDPKTKRRTQAQKKKTPTRTMSTNGIPMPRATNRNNGVSNDTMVTARRQQPTLKENLQQKQDSVLALAQVGKISHEALIIERVTLHFNFEFNSSALDKKAADYLDELADALNDNPQLSLRLVGHTDNIGAVRFNERLSLQRANSVKSKLVEKGVDPHRIITEGKGMAEPLNNNENDEARAKNRRVELTIMYK